MYVHVSMYMCVFVCAWLCLKRAHINPTSIKTYIGFSEHVIHPVKGIRTWAWIYVHVTNVSTETHLQ